MKMQFTKVWHINAICVLSKCDIEEILVGTMSVVTTAKLHSKLYGFRTIVSKSRGKIPTVRRTTSSKFQQKMSTQKNTKAVSNTT